VSGRIVLLTGATGVIGRAAAAELCDADTTLVLHYRSDPRAAEELRDLLRPKARDVVTVAADLSAADAPRHLVEEVADRVGVPDVVVGNAARLRPALLHRIRADDWASTLQLNLTAPMNLAAAVLPHMVAAGFGRIVFVTSVSALRGRPYQGAYASSKAALLGLMKTISHECARYGVTANAVAPGYVESPMSRQGGAAARDAIIEQTPAGRAGTPEEVAAAIGFLCSRRASYITGQVIAVDGGSSM
jgi:3-oxoacyl-[acyl-carrier protein] reductase